MAGSYEMARERFSLIENLGDASEAMHEMIWLIENAIGYEEALGLLHNEYYPMARGEKQKDGAFLTADEAQEN